MVEARFSYQTPAFYLRHMSDAIEASQSGDLPATGVAVFSFFSGTEYRLGTAANLESYHFMCVIHSSEISSFIGMQPTFLLKWIQALFHYCRSMAAMPEIVETVWPVAAKMVDELKGRFEFEGMLASSQLATWDYFYGKANHPSYLEGIKKWNVTHPRAIAYRNLLCSTAINRDSPDFKGYVQECYSTKKFYTHENQAIAILSYYCHIEESERILNELLHLISTEDMKALTKSGNCDFLKGIIGHFYDNNNYQSLFKLLSSMKNVAPNAIPGHGFVLSNGQTLTTMTASSRINFPAEGNYPSYERLIKIRNQLLNVYVSLLGTPSQDASCFDADRRGTPAVDDDLSSYRDIVIDHFRLNNDIYDEVNSITLAPSHDFPIQAARFGLGKNAPWISASLEVMADDLEEHSFVFMLASHTHTVNVEQAFIRAHFSASAEIYIDPCIETFTEIFKSERHSVIYISAHGMYNHWGGGKEDHILFSDECIIPGDVLHSCIPKSPYARNVILNICNGATVEISCNPYSRGLAASIARGNQRVVSHLWPVNPIYAASFGLLVLHYLRERNLLDASRNAFAILNREKDSIIQMLRSLGADFDALSDYLEKTEFKMNVFKKYRKHCSIQLAINNPGLRQLRPFVITYTAWNVLIKIYRQY